MARAVTTRRKVISTAAAWLAGFLIFFPILWMVLASFKTELDAFATPPSFLFFRWTTENYATVQERSDYLHHALNSIIIAGGSTLIALLIAIPSAWSMAFSPTKRTKDLLLWMLSTKMMPPVGVLVPIYLIYRNIGLLDLILAWNEAFWTLNLSTSQAAPLTVFIASYSSPEGLFWAKLSAASTLAIAPILVLGWFSQKQLVRGLTFGAVK